MSYNSHIVNGYKATGILNIDAATAGTITAGPSLLMERVAAGTLSATVMVEAETNTITMAAVWQVSSDNSTWVTLKPSNHAATVTLATGTAGDDAAVTNVIAANPAVYGWRYARCSITNGVVTGTTNDKYSIAYNYVKPSA